MAIIKTFKNARRAIDTAREVGGVVIKVGNLWLVSDDQLGLEEIAVLDGGSYRGNVTTFHLVRLGNANWAEPRTIGGAPMNDATCRAVANATFPARSVK